MCQYFQCTIRNQHIDSNSTTPGVNLLAVGHKTGGQLLKLEKIGFQGAKKCCQRLLRVEETIIINCNITFSVKGIKDHGDIFVCGVLSFLRRSISGLCRS